MSEITITPTILRVLSKAIRVALDYEKLTGRKLGITGEIGEVVVCDKLNLSLSADPLSAGYDAIDNKGKTYQIKSKRVIKNEGRMSTFSKHKFDYAVLVLFGKDYKIKGMWKTEFEKISHKIEKHKKRNPPIREFKSVAQEV